MCYSGKESKKEADYSGRAGSLKTGFYMQQISIEFRFQEPISLADYKTGTRQSDEVKLSNIDTVPLTVMHGSDDAICPLVMA